ncbi:integral membrane sensor signal transduction histidine kinase [Parvibaculum lavamentivorans DS-1]|uniref:histidine kinase n=1 Tax=Parvibaculum lavamentivorans (strain DS-1 / DSM 13023 / NCIMB 13966) TaxID=402881 RepID=A7HY73_PARL1|nr:ATP-binding protein [Parvibaculum lavamentivorans]ABS64856.1 integral membrane sensor signal transduction histidine kinase [Parvibaculum lavamentivorans DS-1]
MTYEHASKTERGALAEAFGAAGKGQRRGGVLSAVDRLLGRLSAWTTSALLTAAAVIMALGLNWILSRIGLIDFTGQIVISTVIVTILVGFPIIIYSQFIIRELKTSRRTLRKMTERLAWAFDNAERANEAKSNFLANMSHELRTPLNAIIGFSDIIRFQRFGSVGNSRYQDYAKDINESGIHLLSIINDILDLAKIDAGHGTMEQEAEFSVRSAIDCAERMVRSLAERQEISLSTAAAETSAYLVGVERMVRQVLINVLSNAIKFTERGGSVTVAAEHRPNGNLVVSISDTGIGMSPDEVKVALTPFGQSGSALSRKHPGTGLGLPLAKAMMDMHGGRLMVRSMVGKGTTVTLVFPSGRVLRTSEKAVPLAGARQTG